MNLSNIDRDCFWLTSLLTADKIGWSSNTAGLVNSDGVVHTDVATLRSTGATSGTGTQAVGVFMSPPLEDNVPYRVKLHAPADDALFLLLGYAPGTITGTDDALSHYWYMPVEYDLDEVIMLPAHDPGDSLYNRPYCFGVACQSTVVAEIAMSVQKLDIAPPQFGKGVS